MEFSPLHFFPLPLPFLLVFFLLLGFLILLVQIGILEYAYEKMGIHRRQVFVLLLLSLLGSYVNIPVAQLPAEKITSGQEIFFFGMRYVIPLVQEWPRTVIAVNLGGAVVPTLVSLYLMVKNKLYVRGLMSVTIVAAIVHWLAQPVAGLGIAVPIFIPPLVAAGTALLISRRTAPPLAYIAGSLGTLVGGDLLNLNRLQGLGAPIASIGGAGTFDGIFLAGIIAVLLA
ncbi:MAG TPA: DUF1614 domain-containing protein [Candidatus Binatia bacterium]